MVSGRSEPSTAKPLRILHVIPSMSPCRGGPAFALAELAQGLVHEGLHIDIATTDDDGRGRLPGVSPGKPLAQGGFRVFYFPRQLRFYTVSVPLFHWLDRNLGNYDLVHLHALFTFPTTVAARLARRQGIPYIVRPLGTLADWGLENRRPFLKRVSIWFNERSLILSAARLHCTSEMERIEAERNGFTFQPMVVPNIVSGPSEPESHLAGRFRRLFPEIGDRPFVLFMSRIDEKKGLDILIEAFAAMADREHLLVIAGTGKAQLESSLRRKVTRLGLESRIVWTGFLDGDLKWAALTAASLFALTSRSENFGIAPIEALCAGTPVLVSEHVGVHEQIQLSKAGWSVPCDVGSVRAALEAILDRSDLSRVGKRGAELARSCFSRTVVSGRVIRAYQEVLSGH